MTPEQLLLLRFIALKERLTKLHRSLRDMKHIRNYRLAATRIAMVKVSMIPEMDQDEYEKIENWANDCERKL